MGARLYDSELGVFASADRITQSPGNSQNYSSYSYVFNNPLKYSDPSGMSAVGGGDDDSDDVGMSPSHNYNRSGRGSSSSKGTSLSDKYTGFGGGTEDRGGSKGGYDPKVSYGGGTIYSWNMGDTRSPSVRGNSPQVMPEVKINWWNVAKGLLGRGVGLLLTPLTFRGDSEPLPPIELQPMPRLGDPNGNGEPEGEDSIGPDTMVQPQPDSGSPQTEPEGDKKPSGRVLSIYYPIEYSAESLLITEYVRAEYIGTVMPIPYYTNMAIFVLDDILPVGPDDMSAAVASGIMAGEAARGGNVLAISSNPANAALFNGMLTLDSNIGARGLVSKNDMVYRSMQVLGGTPLSGPVSSDAHLGLGGPQSFPIQINYPLWPSMIAVPSLLTHPGFYYFIIRANANFHIK